MASKRVSVAFLVVVVLSVLPAQLWAGSRADDWQRGLRTRDVALLQRLAAQGADVNAAAADGKTALMFAAGQGRTDVVADLLQRGARIDSRNGNGGTALMYAALSGNAETVALLVHRGADVNAVAANGWSALTIAGVKDHADIVRLLLNAGANPNQRDIYRWTPLMRAAYQHRSLAVAALLQDKRVQVNARDDQGATALHHAAARGYADIVRLLLKAGADPTIADAAGRTPARTASLAGSDTAAVLIRQAVRSRRPR